ncbi:MAG: hypothetical protein PHV18_10275 [Lachnospiraceae bacterium]|nr:hypothetical protein [Lachnospiraceae bacterium]
MAGMEKTTLAGPQEEHQALTFPAGHWSLGDVVVRSLDGMKFRFRCIDENYSDGMEYHVPSALFLCDTVIPADFGSKYVFEPTEDGKHDYVFYPGEIVNFGTSNDYKYSNIRSWLNRQSEAASGALPIAIGVDRAYSGRTGATLFGQLDQDGLTGAYIGYQKMTDRLFVLSVDEALKYRQWMWRFDGSERENPETQYGEYSKGYWLRNPAGTRGQHDTGLAYVVDLLDGTIRPAAVRPEDVSEEWDPELKVTATIGVRPAFVLAQ